MAYLLDMSLSGDTWRVLDRSGSQGRRLVLDSLGTPLVQGMWGM